MTVYSHLCAVVSDIHFPHHHRAGWEAFLAWCTEWRPRRVVVDGDTVDFAALSRYTKGPDTELHVIDEVKAAVGELNRLAAVTDLVDVIEGNHCERWGNLVAAHAMHLKGAIGLTLEEQMRFQGLDSRVRWTREDVLNKGVKLGPFRVRHGHKQCGPYGVQHVAAKLLANTLHTSQIVGHHHRAQMMCKTAEGEQIVAIANPHLSADHAYATDPNWQRGFTVVECFGEEATAYPVVMTIEGRFAWGGRVYGATIKSSATDSSSIPARAASLVAAGDGKTTAPEPRTPGAVSASGFARASQDSTGVDVGDLDWDDERTQPRSPTPTSKAESLTFAAAGRIWNRAESSVRDWCKRTGRPPEEYRPTAKGAAL